MTTKDVIIDTDIGDDIDDAYALAFALNSPELNLRAVTTVFGNVDIRTKLALKVLKVFEREDIPVATGIGRPLLERSFRAHAEEQIPRQAVVLEERERLPKPSPRHAIDLIASTVMENNGETTIVPIGALTNVATAIIKEPKLSKKARIVMMGGCISRPVVEYNIRCDPEAAKIVFESGIPITMVGLDVTMKCVLNREDVNKLRSAELATTKLLADMTDAWAGERPVLHDPLAVAVSFNPDLVKTQPKLVRVETRGDFTRGLTVIYESGKPNAQVCIDVDSNRFIKLFMNRILKASR